MVDSLDFLNENDELNEAEGRRMREDEEAGLARAAAEALTAATSRAAYEDLLARARRAPDEVSTRQGLLDQAEQLLKRADELRDAAARLLPAIHAGMAANPHRYDDPRFAPPECALVDQMAELERIHRDEAKECQWRATTRIPVDGDRAAALEAEISKEMVRRNWPCADAVRIALDSKRQQLEWNQMQPWSRRLISKIRGENTSLTRQIGQLEINLKQSLSREEGLRQHLLSDPISSSIVNEESERLARERAERHEEAAHAAAAREATTEANRHAALQREREALRQHDTEKEDEATRPKKKSGGAPKPR